MTAQSYYPESPHSDPQYVILDTADLIATLRQRTERLKELDAQETEIIELVIQSLMFRRDAEMELDYNCLDVVREVVGTVYENDMETIARAVRTFGLAVFEELQRLEAYTNGYLFYQFMQLINSDIVLVKTVPPDLPR